MLGEIAFYAVSVFTIAVALLVFAARSLLRAVVALTLVFFGSSLVMLLLGQSFFAMLQLLIFIGGLSTYLLVAVGSEARKIGRVNLKFFAAMLVAAIAFLYALLAYIPEGSFRGISMLGYVPEAIAQYYMVMYVIVVLVFSVAIASILLIRRISKLVV